MKRRGPKWKWPSMFRKVSRLMDTWLLLGRLGLVTMAITTTMDTMGIMDMAMEDTLDTAYPEATMEVSNPTKLHFKDLLKMRTKTLHRVVSHQDHLRLQARIITITIITIITEAIRKPEGFQEECLKDHRHHHHHHFSNKDLLRAPTPARMRFVCATV
mmetsp:Transcript_62187/g.116357  ORF Transcript_62187/g.116357 Transcript_62187/m.116357 type:complete len:158 (+) Transcript_62187:159-632(+)